MLPITQQYHSPPVNDYFRIRPAAKEPKVNDIESPSAGPRLAPEKFPPNHPIWEEYVEHAMKYDAKMIATWTQGLDVLLVFTGLLSAVVTAFLIETSKQLDRDPLNTTNELLVAISKQLRYISDNTNLSIPAVASLPTTRFIPDDDGDQVFLVNALMFACLACCVIAAAGALLAKIWLIEYRSQIDAPIGGAYFRATMHQRSVHGLQEWHFSAIMEALPIIGLLALLIFYFALHAFIQNRQPGIGYALALVFTIAITFAFMTSIGAAFIPHCPFRTPFSRLLTSLSQWLPKDIHNYTIAVVCAATFCAAGSLGLMAFVTSELSITLFISGIAIAPLFKIRVEDKNKAPHLLTVPFFVGTSLAAMFTVISIVSYYNKHRWIYAGVGFGAFVLWALACVFATRYCRVVPDTVEIDALAWVLRETNPYDPAQLIRAAGHADSGPRKYSLLRYLVPLVEHIKTTQDHQSPHGDLYSEEDMKEWIQVIRELREFDQERSWKQNAIAMKLPDNISQFLDSDKQAKREM